MGDALPGSRGPLARRVLRLDEGGAPGVGDAFGGDQVGVGLQRAATRRRVPACAARVAAVPASASRAALVNWAGFDVERLGPEVERELVGVGFAFGLVAGLELGGPVLVVVAEHDERGVGDVVAQQRRGGAQQCVADPEVGVEERERAVGVEGFQPQRDLGDLDGQVVEVHAVDAVFDDVGGGRAYGGGAGLGVAGAHGGQRSGDPAGGGDHEMPAAAGGVDNGQRQQGLLRVGGAHRLVDQRVEGFVEDEVRSDRRGCSRSRTSCARCRWRSSRLKVRSSAL